MKIRNIISSCMALLAMGAMTSCQNSFDDPGLYVPVAQKEANTTIAEFKAVFENESDQPCPYKDEETKTPYIIKGRVISSDATGNIYQTLCIQDETSAMTFAIRRAGLYDYYHIGQEIVVDVTGLWVGKYNYLMQIGWLGESSAGVPQMSRMDFSIFQQHVELNGNPTLGVEYITPAETKPEDSMYCIVENIDQLPSAPGEEFYNLQGQLVEFRNVSFEGAGELTYAPYQESVSRYITQEGNSSKLCVRNSGYATFYGDVLPTGVGTVRGILSYYASDPSYATSDGSVNGWQLLIRSLDDVEFNEKGQKSDPYTVEEAIDLQDQSRSGWTKGYIVGTVNAGVQNVASNSDITFGVNDDTMDNNLVIAASADETDWTKCIAIALPQGSDLRKYGNLVDNPGVYKSEILIQGSLSRYLGMPGIGCSGSATSFEIDGVEIGGGDEPSQGAKGDGSQENPFNVAYVQESTADATGVWIEGYVVGYVADLNWSSTAVFGTQPTEGSTNYTNGTNCILSDVAPGAAGLDNSIPCGLSTTGDVRSKLGISKNPAIYGTKVKVKGDIQKYFGVRAVKNVTEYVIDGESGGDTPVTPPSTGQGDGTEANPYDVAFVSSSTVDATGVWVTGYVAGYVPGMNWSEAVFGTQPTEGSTNYTNGTNCILSSVAPTASNASNSIPVGLGTGGDVRATIAVGKNPAIYGKKVMLKGDIVKYFGIRGFKNVSEYKILE